MRLIDELFVLEDPPPGLDWTGGREAARSEAEDALFDEEAAASDVADVLFDEEAAALDAAVELTVVAGAEDWPVALLPFGIPCIVFLKASISEGFCIKTENPCFCR